MENEKKVQGRGFFVLNGQVFSRNMEAGTLPKMNQDLAKRIKQEKNLDVVRLNFAKSQNAEVVARQEEVISKSAPRNLER